MENINNELEELLTSMSETFRKRDFIEYQEEIAVAFEEFEKFPSISNFERYSYKQSKKMDTIIDALIERETDSREAWRIKSVYKHISTIDNFVKFHISQFEGGACSRDKSVSILNLFVRNEFSLIKNGKSIFESDTSFDVWNLPKIGSLALWFNLVEALVYFYSGHIDKFDKAIEELQLFYSN